MLKRPIPQVWHGMVSMLRGAGRHASSISPYPVQAVARLGYTSISTSDARIFGEKGLRAAQY